VHFLRLFFFFFRKRQDGSVSNFFQGLGKNTCLLQPALKSNAPPPGLLDYFFEVLVLAKAVLESLRI